MIRMGLPDPPSGGPGINTKTKPMQNNPGGEFNKQNFGGALYLANQVKTIAGTGRTRAAAGSKSPSRPGETQFALPIRLKAANRGNVRRARTLNVSSV